MKKVTILALFVSLFVLFLNGVLRAEESVKRYRIESGLVEYALTGSQTGTETLEFDRWGAREVKHTKAEITTGGVTRKIERLMILDGEWMYNIDMVTRVGTRMPQSMLRELLDRSGAADMTEVSENSMREMGGVKTGTEEISGRTCDVWGIEKLRAKNWIWRGLSLKTTTDMPGVHVESVASRVEESHAIPPEHLRVPDGVRITDDPNDPNEQRSGVPRVKKEQPPEASE